MSALAAPKSSRLWPELAKEIEASLREGGARVRSFTGDWGRELHATTGAATSVFIGVDGPRWMLYGVATGPTDRLGRRWTRSCAGCCAARWCARALAVPGAHRAAADVARAPGPGG